MYVLLRIKLNCTMLTSNLSRHIFQASRGMNVSSNCMISTHAYQERIVCLNGEVNESLSAAIVAQLLFLESDAPEKAITLYINSPGGSVTAGLAIYDTMTYIKSPVSTVCVGQAASMGALLLCGGEKGKRYCLPNSSIMVHQPSGGYMGQASDIAIHATEILRVRRQLNSIYVKHLSKAHTLEDIERIMERDKFLSAQEALEMGIVDEILERRVQTEDVKDAKGKEAEEKSAPGEQATDEKKGGHE
jgi:ATP-dependent Clp protease protease subunit